MVQGWKARHFDIAGADIPVLGGLLHLCFRSYPVVRGTAKGTGPCEWHVTMLEHSLTPAAATPARLDTAAHLKITAVKLSAQIEQGFASSGRVLWAVGLSHTPRHSPWASRTEVVCIA